MEYLWLEFYLDFNLQRLLDGFDLNNPLLLLVQVFDGVLQFSLKEINM